MAARAAAHPRRHQPASLARRSRAGVCGAVGERARGLRRGPREPRRAGHAGTPLARRRAGGLGARRARARVGARLGGAAARSDRARPSAGDRCTRAAFAWAPTSCALAGDGAREKAGDDETDGATPPADDAPGSAVQVSTEAVPNEPSEEELHDAAAVAAGLDLRDTGHGGPPPGTPAGGDTLGRHVWAILRHATTGRDSAAFIERAFGERAGDILSMQREARSDDVLINYLQELESLLEVKVQRGAQEQRLARQLEELRGDATLGVAGALARMHAPWLHRAVAMLYELDGVDVRWPTAEQRLPWTQLSAAAGLECDSPAVAVAGRHARAQAWREAGREAAHEDAAAETALAPRALALHLRHIGEDLEAGDVALVVGVVDFPFSVQPGEACEHLQRNACEPAGTMRLSTIPSVWLQRVRAPLEEQVALLCRALGVEGFVPRALEAALGPGA